jgi:hypothetical protein
VLDAEGGPATSDAAAVIAAPDQGAASAGEPVEGSAAQDDIETVSSAEPGDRHG